MNALLVLVHATQTVLRNVLALLGLSAPERMQEGRIECGRSRSIFACAIVKGSRMKILESIDEIQSDFAGYLRKAKVGETVPVTQFGQPSAEIKPVLPAEEGRTRSLRPIGLAEGEFVVPDDFDAPLPEDILRDFEG